MNPPLDLTRSAWHHARACAWSWRLPVCGLALLALGAAWMIQTASDGLDRMQNRIN